MEKKQIYAAIEIIKGMEKQSNTPHIIGALAVAREALGLRLERKVELKGELYRCPNCKKSAAILVGDRHCAACGQALEW